MRLGGTGLEDKKTTILEKIEETIDLIDKLESIVSRLQVGDTISSGSLYQIYETIIILREKIIEIRQLA